MILQIMTANDLHTGGVVFLTKQGHWTRFISEARLVSVANEINKLEIQAHKAVEKQIVVEPFFIKVSNDTGTPIPIRFRERLRVSGPSTRPDFSKPIFSEAT